MGTVTVGGATLSSTRAQAAAALAAPALTTSKSNPSIETVNQRCRPASSHFPAIRKAIRVAIANLVHDGLDDVFRRPFEIDLLKQDPELRKAVARQVFDRIRSGAVESATRPIGVQIPKRNAPGFRNITVLDLVDYVVYLSLALLVGLHLEPQRIATSDRRVFSCRVKPQGGRIFDSRFDFPRFRDQITERLPVEGGHTFVTCDIASFFHSIPLPSLKSRLLDLGVEPWVANSLDVLLRCHAEATGWYGIPIGSNASRILGEAYLTPIDTELLAAGVNFLRYMDDYRFFAPDSPTANAWLDLLIERLSRDGLTLNDRKTTIRRVTRAVEPWDDRQGRSDLVLTVNGYLMKELSPSEQRAIRRRPEPERPRHAQLDESDEEIIYKFNNAFRYFPYRERGCAQAKSVDLAKLVSQLDQMDRISGTKIRVFVNAAFYQNRFDLLELIRTFLDCSSRSTWYCVDFLKQEADKLPGATRRMFADSFAGRLLSSAPGRNHLAIAWLDLLGTDNYARSDAVLAFYRGRDELDCLFVRRMALDALHGRLQPEVMKSLLLEHELGHPWLDRALLRTARECLPDDSIERLLSLEESEDPFVTALCAV